jgi:recombinational DNA repair protein (RecF pathway)
MYDRYATEAIVLGSIPRGEADKTLRLMTRDFGLVYARGISVRKEASKLRYTAQSYSRIKAELVRGKQEWRFVGASLVVDGQATGVAQDGIRAFARIAALVMRLVHGEDHDEYLFDTLAGAHAALVCLQSQDVMTIEILAVARVLYALGYVSDEVFVTTLFSHTDYTREALAEAESLKDPLLSSINKALAEVHF